MPKRQWARCSLTADFLKSKLPLQKFCVAGAVSFDGTSPMLPASRIGRKTGCQFFISTIQKIFNVVPFAAPIGCAAFCLRWGAVRQARFSNHHPDCRVACIRGWLRGDGRPRFSSTSLPFRANPAAWLSTSRYAD
jgi:hypothetical protein